MVRANNRRRQTAIRPARRVNSFRRGAIAHRRIGRRRIHYIVFASRMRPEKVVILKPGAKIAFTRPAVMFGLGELGNVHDFHGESP